MGKTYPKILIEKYRTFLLILESIFVGANNEVTFNLNQLIKRQQVSSCLTTMFIKLGYIEKIGLNKFRILKAHAFQSMARNPEEALKLVTSYNYERKLLRGNPEPEIIESPFQEETEVPDELADKVFKDISIRIAAEARDIADEKLNELHTAVNKILNSDFSNAKINIGNYDVKVKEIFRDTYSRSIFRDLLMPGCVKQVEEIFLLGIKELAKLKADGDTDKTT